MATSRLTFVLDGRDDLSRILGGAGRSAEQLQRSITEAADGSNRALLTLTQDSNGRLRDMQGRYIAAGDAARLMASRVTDTQASLAGTQASLAQTNDALADTQTAFADSESSLADWSQTGDRARDVADRMSASLMSLAPAAVPVAASLLPIVAGAGAVGVALAGVAAAVIPQIGAMSEAA
ncbi:hypothetical protein ABZ350_31640, partial [Streptomyces uncialis]